MIKEIPFENILSEMYEIGQKLNIKIINFFKMKIILIYFKCFKLNKTKNGIFE